MRQTAVHKRSLPLVHAQPTVRASGPVVMSEPVQSRRALFGAVAALAVPAAANAMIVSCCIFSAPPTHRSVTPRLAMLPAFSLRPASAGAT